MTKEKEEQIFNELKGISYLDWEKVKRIIDIAFQMKIKSVTKTVTLDSFDAAKSEM
ncbi:MULTISPECIES: hypothetical protein [Allobaculum]|uniref:hypothetical protein n=1 Tax=Allobaculum TaxID=174708 RepID=UPI001E428812|nr:MULTISPECIES: hypothetical protein [Allobaculum]UNT92232.1 hypothetical protein KWG61_08350 [Allobaculum sp. Allo2]